MCDAEHTRFSPQVMAEFAKRLREVVATLRHDANVLPLRQQIEYMLQAWHTLDIPTVKAFRTKEPFQGLVRYVISEISIWSVLLDSSDPAIKNRDPNDAVFVNLFEVMLLKFTTQLELLSRIKSEEKLLEEFFAFLEMDAIERRVTVPLLNLDICSDSIAISGFGGLRKIPGPKSSLSTEPLVELSFPVKTGHFTAAVFLFPLWGEIRKRITLVRIGAYPLVAYNHFSIQSFEPWEVPLCDSSFSIRFFWRTTGQT